MIKRRIYWKKIVIKNEFENKKDLLSFIEKRNSLLLVILFQMQLGKIFMSLLDTIKKYKINLKYINSWLIKWVNIYEYRSLLIFPILFI